MTHADRSPHAVFSDPWLSLREPADHRARDAQLTHAADRWLAQRHRDAGPFAHTGQVVDLGSGSGSNLRYLAPRLAGAQHWRLIDHDADLLAQARLRCECVASADGQPIHLETRQSTLAEAWNRGWPEADLVTASALFDLLTAADIEHLAKACQRAGCAALFALSVDGHIRFDDAGGRPVTSDDDQFAFHALADHQQCDKGSGPALGTRAPAVLRENFHRHGFRIREAITPWRLGPESLPLAEALMAGWRNALHEQVPTQVARIDRWHEQRLGELMRGQLSLTVGHRDLLAIPEPPR
ncbi:class I SAM-dependent methyltransferase [Salinicola avicenniae]|uniref:class I SAM-dependent methyltransferase n=1 Tax=Salinicola avicenniae TaxID=2916836 RepID=UPI0020731AE8|nr:MULTISPECIES: class I SAM-dependent methyltransferase [unclassified Salinicola]